MRAGLAIAGDTMTWEVKYRRADGTIANEQAEAGSREAVIADYGRRGVSVLSVEKVARNAQKRTANVHMSRCLFIAAGIAAAVLVIGALGVWLLRSGGAQSSDLRAKKSKRIEEVKPQIRTAEQPKADIAAENAPVPTELPPQKVGEIRDGKILMPSGELHVIKGEVTNTFSRSKGKWAIFNNPSENVIAATLCTIPGETLVGTVRFNGNFTKSFLKSLTTPIVVHEDDPDDVKALKRAVIEAKITLKEAYDRGEDIEQIIIDSREESQRMAQYKQQLKSNLFRVAKDAASADDVDDALNAANLMLEDKGISPIEAGPLTRIKMKLLMNNQNGEEGK